MAPPSSSARSRSPTSIAPTTPPWGSTPTGNCGSAASRSRSRKRASSRSQFLWGQPFSRGNPQAGAIGSDFGHFGLPFWDEVYGLQAQNQRRRELLDD